MRTTRRPERIHPYSRKRRAIFANTATAITVLLVASTTTEAKTTRKILCLHGGGGNGADFQEYIEYTGISDVLASADEDYLYEFFYPNGQYEAGSNNDENEEDYEKDDKWSGWDVDKDDEKDDKWSDWEVDKDDKWSEWDVDKDDKWSGWDVDKDDEKDWEDWGWWDGEKWDKQGGSNLWVPDPPGGKGEPTTDPDVAANSVAELDRYVEEHGPFYGILGYSQGSMFATYYTSIIAMEKRFQVVLLFAGYTPETHLGLLEVINDASPIAVPALVWMGEQDTVIPNSLTKDQASKFLDPLVVVSPNGGHVVPESSDETFEQVVQFIQNPHHVNETLYEPLPPSHNNDDDDEVYSFLSMIVPFLLTCLGI